MSTKDIKKIVLIEPKEKGFNVFSLFHTPRLGVPILATILKSRNFNVTAFVEKIAPIDWDVVAQADLVGISTVSNTAYACYEIASRVRCMGIPVVFGGAHSTFEPEEALQYGDYVLRGEAEECLVSLVEALQGKKDLADVPALSWWQDGQIKHNSGQRFCPNIDITPDFSLVHGFKEFYKKKFHLGFAPLSVLTTRGCPYGCKFCSVIKMSGRKMRKRSLDDVVDEIVHLVTTYKHKNVFFVDDNFSADRSRAKLLLQKIIDKKLDVRLSGQVRIEAAQDGELLTLMKKAGMNLVQIGLESVDPDTLDAFSKKQKLPQMKEAIQKFRDHGIMVHGMFILGSDYDTPKSASNIARFSREVGLVALQICTLGPLPGTELTQEIVAENRLITRDWARYDGNHALIFSKKMRPSDVQKTFMNAYKEFFTFGQGFKYLLHRKFGYAFITLYAAVLSRVFVITGYPYLRFLKNIEKGKYKKEGDNYILQEPVDHQPEEVPLWFPSRSKVAHWFGSKARTYSQFSFRSYFGRQRLFPVVLSLPELKEEVRVLPGRLRAFLKNCYRPVVIDVSSWDFSDVNFWQKISKQINPFRNRVRLLVQDKQRKLFRKVGLLNLDKISIKK